MEITDPLTQTSTPDEIRARTLNQVIKTAVLFGLAAYFAYNVFSGNLSNYINERFVWLSYLAVILFLVLGIASLIALRRGDHSSPYQDGHSQAITMPVIFIVAIPLLLGTLVPSRPLGVEAINGSISVNSAATFSGGIVTKDPLQRNILDWSRLFTQNNLPASFNGEQADVIGFVYREPAYPENHFMAARFTVSCCVADAMPLGLPVYFPEHTTLEDGAWVRVKGVFEAGNFRNFKTPILQAESVEVIEQPEHPYLYP
jgi:putative membrane protein